jgi:hypothetical protein
MKNLNQYKKRFNQLMESQLGNVKPLISEEDEKDPYSDLYGKTVTYKDSQSGVELKGTISHMVMIEPSDILITHNKLYVTEPEVMGYIKGREPSSDNSKLYYSHYDCKTETFSIELIEYIYVPEDKGGGDLESYGDNKVIDTFTCKGLSDVLSQRYPCATDFSMNSDPDIPNNLA